jgi:hypothetical protein
MYKMAEPGELSRYGDWVTGWKTKEFGVPFPARANIFSLLHSFQTGFACRENEKCILVFVIYKTSLSNSPLGLNLLLLLYCPFQLITVLFSLF